MAVISGYDPAVGQPLTDRSPNMDGTWVTPPHHLFFQFSHRFEMAGADADIGDIFGEGKVVNYPTFALSYGLFEGAHVGFRYSSNSILAGQSNEWQPFLKVAPLSGLLGGHLSLALLGAWNTTTESFDGEVAAQFDVGPLTLIAVGRGFTNPFDRAVEEQEAEFAFAGGAVLHLNRYLSLSADYANMVTQSDAQIGWSAGASLAIPYTPHTFALFATNVASGTLQGLSVGLDDTVFWGFEFTIPFTGARWRDFFGPERQPTPPVPPATVPEAGDATPVDPTSVDPTPVNPTAPRKVVEVEISQLSYQQAELRIPVGTTVRWVNRDAVAHTITSSVGAWSSPLMEKDEAFEHTFETTGRFEYVCTPHPFMRGVVVVMEDGA
jgi:amicyanin